MQQNLKYIQHDATYSKNSKSFKTETPGARRGPKLYIWIKGECFKVLKSCSNIRNYSSTTITLFFQDCNTTIFDIIMQTSSYVWNQNCSNGDSTDPSIITCMRRSTNVFAWKMFLKYLSLRTPILQFVILVCKHLI